MMKVGKKMTKKDIKELQKEFPTIPNKTYIYECNECLHTWEGNEEITLQSYCPYCHCGDINQRESILEDDE